MSGNNAATEEGDAAGGSGGAGLSNTATANSSGSSFGNTGVGLDGGPLEYYESLGRWAAEPDNARNHLTISPDSDMVLIRPPQQNRTQTYNQNQSQYQTQQNQNQNQNRTQQGALQNQTQEEIRLGRVLLLLSGSGDGYWDAGQLSALLAVRDWNRRWSAYNPNLFSGEDGEDGEGIGDDCNFYMSAALGEPWNTLVELARQVQNDVLFSNDGGGDDQQQRSSTGRPMAMVGAPSSTESGLLATLGAVATRNQRPAHYVTDPTAAAADHPDAAVAAAPTAVEVDNYGDVPSNNKANEGVPNVSPSATSAVLSDMSQFPLFARTVPSNYGDAAALLLYLRGVGVGHLAVLYVNDDYGTFYASTLSRVNRELFGDDFHLHPFSFTLDSMSTALDLLGESQLRYVFGIFPSDSSLRLIARSLTESGLLGGARSERMWFFSDAFATLHHDGEQAKILDDADLVIAFNNTAVISVRPPPAEFRIHQRMLEEAVRDDEVKRYWSGSSRLENEGDRGDGVNSSRSFVSNPEPSIFAMLAYDAVMALGFAVCQSGYGRDHLLSGPEIHGSLLNKVKFRGATGVVEFNSTTGARALDGVVYQISNFIVFEKVINSTPSARGKASNTTSALNEQSGYLIESVPSVAIRLSDREVVVQRNLTFPPFGSTEPLRDLAPVETYDYSVPVIYQAFCWAAAAFVILFSLYCAVWSIRSRNIPVVRASQPFFLVMLCVGALLLGMSIITNTFQEPMPLETLNAACVARIWLMSIGFSTLFGTLFAKTLRINKVYQNAQRFRRVRIGVRDVLLPLALVLAANAVVLIAWTVIDPVQWRRTVAEEDLFGRPLVTHGGCYRWNDEDEGVSTDATTTKASPPVHQWVFIALLVAVNIVALLLLNYESYRARNLPTKFNESYYLNITNVVILEAYLFMIPLFILASDDPKISMVVGSALDFIVALGVMIPTFIPKFLKRKQDDRRFVSNLNLRQGQYSGASSDSGSVEHSQPRLIFQTTRNWMMSIMPSTRARNVSSNAGNSGSTSVARRATSNTSNNVPCRETNGNWMASMVPGTQGSPGPTTVMGTNSCSTQSILRVSAPLVGAVRRRGTDDSQPNGNEATTAAGDNGEGEGESGHGDQS